MGGGHALEFLVYRAHQHLPPVALDSACGLALFAQPVEHADTVEIGAGPALPGYAIDAPRGRDFIGEAEERQVEEGAEEGRRGGEDASLQDGGPPAWLDEVELAMKTDLAVDTQAPVEIHQIDATAQEDVLAVVDDFRIFTAR